MAILGKRLRSSHDDEPLLSLSPATKRRTRSCAHPEQIFAIHEDDSRSAVGHEIPRSASSHKSPSRSKALTPSPSKGNVQNRTSPLKTKTGSPTRSKSTIVPHTPRRRDAASRNALSTPQHRVTMSGMAYTPRTPRTPFEEAHTHASKQPLFADARRLFSRASGANGLIGRDSERAELSSFVAENIRCQSSGCLYVSGPPGTGKSAFVASVCDTYKSHDSVKYAFLNCMSVRNATDIYSHLVSELGVSDDVFGSLAKDQLSVAFSTGNSETTFLVVLDEIDQMLELDLTALYTLFEWSLTSSSRLILVGIANALDLTDRFLPQLKARHLKPRLLPFLPYSATEIASVISARARTLVPAPACTSADFIPLLTPQAIQLISKKVAAQTGDLRKAFDITYKLIDVLEAESEQNLKAISVQESPSKSPLSQRLDTLSSSRKASVPSKTLTYETAPRATLSHVLRVVNAAFTANSTVSRLGTLNLQQRAVLCAMSALETSNHQRMKLQRELEQSERGSLPSPADTPTSKRTKMAPQFAPRTNHAQQAAPTVREVYEAYSKLCSTEHLLPALSFSEFRDVMSNLETAGLVNGVDGRGSLVQVAPGTPSKKGRGTAGPMLSVRVDDCRITGTASAAELERVLEGAGCDVLLRMLKGEGF